MFALKDPDDEDHDDDYFEDEDDYIFIEKWRKLHIIRGYMDKRHLKKKKLSMPVPEATNPYKIMPSNFHQSPEPGHQQPEWDVHADSERFQ
jgi:hypothetical protein